MTASWVAMGEMLQNLQVSSFNKPLFLTWAVHSGYALALIPAALLRCCAARQRGATDKDAGKTSTGDTSGEMLHRVTRTIPSAIRGGSKPAQSRRCTCRRSWTTAALAVLAALAGYLWYVSLKRTTAAANAAIYQCGPALVFVLSVLALGERVTVRKVLAVALCVGGVVAVTLSHPHTDNPGLRPSALGYAFELGSVLSYALYEVCFKRWFEGEGHEPAPSNKREPADSEDAGLGRTTGRTYQPSVEGYRARPPSSGVVEQAADSFHTLGMIGLWSIALLPPFMPLLDAAGLEPFEWPPAPDIPLIALNIGLDLCFNSLLLVSISLTGPVFVSLGTTFVVPASLVVDWFIHHTELSPRAFVGVALILVGFVVLLQRPPERLIRWLPWLA